jgi:hypothetical protein
MPKAARMSVRRKFFFMLKTPLYLFRKQIKH